MKKIQFDEKRQKKKKKNMCSETDEVSYILFNIVLFYFIL